MGRFSEAVDKDPALFASSYYCLENLPKIMMIPFGSHYCSCLPTIYNYFILLGVWPGGVCVYVYTLPVLGYSAIVHFHVCTADTLSY